MGLENKELLNKLRESVKRVEHQLIRCRRNIEIMSSKYNGKERQFTFHGGFDYGYEKGRCRELEDKLDELHSIIEAVSPKEDISTLFISDDREYAGDAKKSIDEMIDEMT